MQESSSSTQPLTPGTSVYKKARKAFLKSAQNRSTGDAQEWSPFRTAEKRYKAKFPPPDLSDVLDLAQIDEWRQKEVENGAWRGRSDAFKVTSVRLKLPSSVNGDPSQPNTRAFVIERVPGLVILPGYLSQRRQQDLVRWSLSEHARYPNITNLDAHYVIPKEGIWQLYCRTSSQLDVPKDQQVVVKPPWCNGKIQAEPSSPSLPSPMEHPAHATAMELIFKLRWANIGWFYNWGTKQYDFSMGRVKVGEPVKSICKEIVQSIDWNEVFGRTDLLSMERQSNCETDSNWRDWETSYEPDAGIVNFYGHKDTMMGHVDRSEVCATSPLVSLSLGNAAVFLIGGFARDEEPVALLLRSGDAVVMAGPICRRAYHGVPRILEGTLPQHLQPQAHQTDDWNEFGKYLQSRRININVRQVFPRGFDPSGYVST